MNTTISARHCDVTPLLRERALAVAERLGTLSPHALEAVIVFDASPSVHSVDIRLHARGRKVLVGIGEGADHRSALDRAEDKLRPQILTLKAAKPRVRARRAPTRGL